MDQEQRSALVIFVAARSRLARSVDKFRMPLKIVPRALWRVAEDRALPRGTRLHTSAFHYVVR
jgi:hypothetical protein